MTAISKHLRRTAIVRHQAATDESPKSRDRGDGGIQSAMSGTGMTQEMEMLAFEGSQGVELTDEEAEESARAYDEAQVCCIPQKPHL